MISHEHKCILIHMPRTGGSSFEKLLYGDDWWSYQPKTKHILASQAKEIYKEYWDEYFKFSIIRNPYDRCVSLLNFSETYYGYKYRDLTKKKFEWYKRKFNYPFTVEYDYRFYSLPEVITEKHSNNQIYGNFLDEELDYIGRLETLNDDFKEISKVLGLKKDLVLPTVAKSIKKRNNYREYYTDELREIVERLYAKDLKAYDYSF